MNIALGAVIIFILLIPSIAFYISYTSGRHTKGGLKISFLDGLLASAIVSLIIHSIAIWVVGKEIRFDILLKMTGGELKDLENKLTNAELTKSVKQFARYNFAVCLIMIVLGQLARVISVWTSWHSDFEVLRIHNKWWYLFEGYTEINDRFIKRDFDGVVVDLVVDTTNGTMIYTGTLESYVCSGEDLDRIYISEAWRRELKKEMVDDKGEKSFENKPGRAKRIPGDTLMIPYTQIKNMNLRFFSLEEGVSEIEQLPDKNPDSVE
jgi:hypothetical protein